MAFTRMTSPMLLNTLSIITLAVAAHGFCTSNYCNISEHAPPLTVVYTVPNGFTNSPIFSSGNNIAQTSFSKHFDTSQDGAIRVSPTAPLDRNTMALELGNSILPVIYKFTLVSKSGLPPYQVVTFHVTGLDNMVPNFTNNAVNFSIVEGNGIPSSWPMQLAIDYDEGINTTQNYYIDNPNANTIFNLTMVRDSAGAITILQLRRKIPIDREQTPSFNFTIVAEEGRPNAPKGYQQVYITVEDLCDFVPVFPVTSYQTEVPENTSVNSVVLKVTAMDLDVGGNEPLSYSIVSQCVQSIQSGACQNGIAPFTLDKVNGNLILIQKLDFGLERMIDLIVTATDSCSLVGTTQVLVTVTYVDDKPPNIQVVLVSNGMIREDYTLSSDIATVTITSPVTFTVVVVDNSTGLVSNTFYLMDIGSSYRLRLLHSLDSKVQSSYNVTIKATDAGNNVAYSTITITVLAVNHPPSFDKKTAFISIPGNTRNGTVVLHVHASDNDVGGSGVVTYQLPPPNATFPYQNNFTVNATSGDILVNGVLDRTVAKNFLLLVMARDNPTNGEPYLSDYMVANITLLDPNGNRPIFLPQLSQVSIAENVIMGSVIFQVTTYNPDSVPNGTIITYGLVPSSTFRIDSVSGVISVVGSLNYSTTQQYVLNITAYNGFPPPSTYILTINVLPGDTVGPVFAPRVYNVQVMRTAAVGSHVVDINAVDTYSSAVLYEIKDGNGNGDFTINPANGIITAQNQLSTQTYTLYVKASDGRYYSKWLAVVVVRIMDFTFTNALYIFQVREGLLSGTVVGTMSTLLSNAGPGQVFFTLLSPSDAFALGPTSGTIITTRALSAVSGGYNLTVGATYYPSDQGMLPTSIQQTVGITVTKQPGIIQFQQSSYSTTISRSLDIGTSVLNVTTSTTTMGVVTYSLSSSNPIPFRVDANTGSIYTSAYLDSMPRYTYTFDVVASGYGSQVVVTVSVQVNILIVFDQQQYVITIPATATKGSVVTTIRATGRRGIPVYYYFSNDAPKSYLQIDKVSGEITLLIGPATKTKRQSNSPIIAMILAQDSQDPSINLTVSVTLTLPATILQQIQTNPTSGVPLTLIIGAVAGGVLVLAVIFVAALVAITVIKRKRKPIVEVTEGGVINGSNRNSAVLTSFEQSCPAPHPQITCDMVAPDPPTPRIPSKDDMAKGEPVYRTPSLRNVPHARSTSDLASTIGTELLSGPEDMGPYTKAQIMAIYAANAQLLQEGVSQDSIHMFGSEGGVEVDEVDISHMMFGKAMGFEDEDELSVMEEDHTSVQQPSLQEQKDNRINAKRLWLLSSVGSESDNGPRYDNTYSQSSSTYSQAYDEGGGSQTFHLRQTHDGHMTHDQGYYNEVEQQWSPRFRLPTNERLPPNMYTAPTLAHQMKKAIHSSILESGPMSTHSHHLKYSQDLTCPDASLAANLHNHTPLSGTQTDDGNNANSFTHRGDGPSYYYASSSSIASTNLSQTVPRNQNLYNPSL